MTDIIGGIQLPDDEETRRIMREALEGALPKSRIKKDAAGLSGSLAKFIGDGWVALKPQEIYRHNWHIDAICERLEAITSGEIYRLQIWVPPGTMKSLSVSVFWPAWEWTIRPSTRYWGASYEVRLAGRLAAMSRDLMMSDWYQERWGHLFQFVREGENYFGNDQGGTRLATAPNSTGSGEHGHRIIIDDPINAKAADATSRATLDFTNNVWYDGVVSSRGIGDDHARVIVMQRLHEDDLAAHALEIEEWEILCLPERYEAAHPYAWHADPRQEGQLLWPEHRGEKTSDALAKSLTAHRAAGQLQQRPSAKEGEIIKTHWWRFYDSRHRTNENWSALPKFSMVVMSVDTPQKDKESNDNVAIQCWGVYGADRYLLDIRLGKMNYGLAKRTVREMAVWARKTWPGARHFVLIENAGYGVEMIIDLKREITGVTKISQGSDGDKAMRAETATDALESGNVFLPGHGPPWQPAYDEQKSPADIVAFISNCARFPNATHDDDVDSWSMAMNWLRTRHSAPMRTSSAVSQRRGAPTR